jgi:putative FmdB family regulatory protein
LTGFERVKPMPIYEYQCQACGHELEKIQRMSDEPLTDCPKCGKAELRKKISAAGFRLKGGGWYETDFKKGGQKNVHGSDSAASKPAPAGATETKAKSKTAAKTPKSDSGTA